MEDAQRGAGAWLDYGAEGYRQRPTIGPQDSDPYVEVPPVLPRDGEEVGDYLASRDVLLEMEELAGPAWPVPQDWGVMRYQRVRDRVYMLVRGRFPDYIDG